VRELYAGPTADTTRTHEVRRFRGSFMDTGLAHPPLGDYDRDVADEAGHGILGQRTHMTWTLRSAAHSVTAITTYGRTLRKRWLVLGAAAFATDPSIARAVAGEGALG
jgi:hypothetical protein